MTSANATFLRWWSEYEHSGSLGPIRLGMMREDIKVLFGEPDRTSIESRRRPLEGIWKFGEIEFHFDRDGRLFLIYTEDADLQPTVIATS